MHLLIFYVIPGYLMGNINVVAYNNFSVIQAEILHKKMTSATEEKSLLKHTDERKRDWICTTLTLLAALSYQLSRTGSYVICTLSPFQAPHVENDEVQNFKVKVQGETFLSTEERKVMIKPYKPMTFVQTDKPIYNPGQTGNFTQSQFTISLLAKKQDN